MLDKVEAYCRRHRLFQPGDTLVVACSGGPDSLALLDVLSRLAPAYDLQLIACYVHHGIRRAADAEVDFVRRESARRHCQFVWARVDVPALAAQRHESEETTGRTERYRILRETASTYDAAAIAVAHHQDDQAETVLHHLLRGSGMTGLSGMKPKADGVIRPFLSVTRHEIEAYNQAGGLIPCEDETNQSTLYTRNRIRLELLPMLQTFNPSVVADLNRLADIACVDDEFLDTCAKATLLDLVHKEGPCYCLSKAKLLAQPLALQRRIVRHLYQQAAGAAQPIPFHYVTRLLELAHETTGRRFDTSLLRVYTTYDELCFAPPSWDIPAVTTSAVWEDACVPITGAGTYQLGTHVLTIRITKEKPDDASAMTYIIDNDKNPGNLELRFRRPGDTIQVGNPVMTKTLKKYFIDRKIPISIRNQIPLLCSGTEVLWICGYAGNTKTAVSTGTTTYMICTIRGGNSHA